MINKKHFFDTIELWKYWVQYTNLCFIEGISYRNYQLERNSESAYQMLVPWERVSRVLELLHDSASAGHFGFEKTYQGLVKSSIGHA